MSAEAKSQLFDIRKIVKGYYMISASSQLTHPSRHGSRAAPVHPAHPLRSLDCGKSWAGLWLAAWISSLPFDEHSKPPVNKQAALQVAPLLGAVL